MGGDHALRTEELDSAALATFEDAGQRIALSAQRNLGVIAQTLLSDLFIEKAVPKREPGLQWANLLCLSVTVRRGMKRGRTVGFRAFARRARFEGGGIW